MVACMGGVTPPAPPPPLHSAGRRVRTEGGLPKRPSGAQVEVTPVIQKDVPSRLSG